MTLTFLANAALRILQVLPTGAGLSSTGTQLPEALDLLNNLVDSWSADKMMAPAALVTLVPLVAAQSTYTIGTGLNFNIARPSAIEAAAVVLSNGITMPVKVLAAKDWSEVPDRAAQAHLVEFLFYDRGFTSGHVFVSPIPIGTPQLELTTWAALAKFPDLVTDVVLAPGYSRMLQLAAALELAPQYPTAKVSDQLMREYADAVAAVRNLNASILGNDPPEGQTGAVAAQ
jgi:hypothetical protein